MSNTLINVAIDDQSVLDDIDACEIKIQESSYCLTASLQLKSKRFWSLCDPTKDWGTLRVKVIIGSTTYQFLIEERDTGTSESGVGFSVWGRSQQAMLSIPFSKTLTDTEESSHPWQTADVSASDIVAYVVANYCDNPPTVTWNVTDFVVYSDSFSVNNQSPVDIISTLANVVGAELVANIDGSLSIESYSVDEESAVESYDDFDEITELSESIDTPSGYNAVTVDGYDDGSSGGDSVGSSMAAVKQGTGAIYPGATHIVRLYHYPVIGVAVYPPGILTKNMSGDETVTEDVRLVFGQGNTQRPNTSGVTEVTGSEDIPFEIVSVSYSTHYTDYNVFATSLGDHEVMFYFSDQSATAFYSFTVVARPDSDSDADGDDDPIDPWDRCGSVKLVRESPTTVTPGSEVILRLYGIKSPSIYRSSSGSMSKIGRGDMDKITSEEVTFVDGEANTEYPMDTRAGGPNVVFGFTSGYSAWPPQYTRGSTLLVKNHWKDNLEYYSIPAKVTYYTMFTRYKFTVPRTWVSSVIKVWFIFQQCDQLDLDIAVDLAGGIEDENGASRDITINIKDYATEVDLETVSVTVDGTWRGNTDASGNLSLSNIAVGDHTIKLTKTGYLNSDLDDLANDTFTVSGS